MSSTTDQSKSAVKILIIDSGQTPIHTEKYQFMDNEGDKIKNTILTSLNRLGKASHALIKYKNDYFIADHTAQGKIMSETYYRTKVKYHPFMHWVD
jgi:hypothetical protein